MQAVIESKIQATHRLQKNGRWNQASLYRERERNRLRDAGWKRADAREEAWRLMIERFQPGDHDAFSSGCTLEFFPPILVGTAEQPVLSIAWLAMWKLLAELVAHDAVLRTLVLGDELDVATVLSLAKTPEGRERLSADDYEPAWDALDSEPSPEPETVLELVKPVLQRAGETVDRGGSELGYRQLTARCLDRILEAWPVIEESVKYFFTAKIQQVPVTSLLGKAA